MKDEEPTILHPDDLYCMLKEKKESGYSNEKDDSEETLYRKELLDDSYQKIIDHFGSVFTNLKDR